MDKKFSEKLEFYKESVNRYLDEDLVRNQEESIAANQEREQLESIIDIDDRDENVLYQKNLERLAKAEQTIKNTKKAAKYSMEQIINALKERNKELAENYLSKRPGEIQLEINNLQTENQRLEFEIMHKQQLIEQTMELINKYTEIGDIERKTELEKKVQGLRDEVNEKREKQNENLDKLETCKNYEQEYKNNTMLIKEYRERAKTAEIELEEKAVETTEPRQTTPEPTPTTPTTPTTPVTPAEPAAEQPAEAQEPNTTTPEPAAEQPAEAQEPNTTTPEPAAGQPAEAQEPNTTIPENKKMTTTRIKLNISKEGTQIVVSKKEEGKFIENVNKGKLNKLAKEIGTQDEIIRTEINKAVAEGILTADEAKKEIELYEKLTQSDDKKEKETIKDKMKLKLNYDLSGMRKAKLSPTVRGQMRANAAESLKLGIGNVTPAWMKLVVQAEASWVGKFIKGLGQKVAGCFPVRNEDREETVDAATTRDIVNTVADVQREPVCPRVPVDVAAAVERASQPNGEEELSNDGVEPDQD